MAAGWVMAPLQPSCTGMGCGMHAMECKAQGMDGMHHDAFVGLRIASMCNKTLLQSPGSPRHCKEQNPQPCRTIHSQQHCTAEHVIGHVIVESKQTVPVLGRQALQGIIAGKHCNPNTAKAFHCIQPGYWQHRNPPCVFTFCTVK